MQQMQLPTNMPVQRLKSLVHLLIFLLITGVNTFAQKQPAYNTRLYAMYGLLNDKLFEPVTLENENGETYNTAALKGKTLYVDFWFTSCLPCLKEIPCSEALKIYFQPDTSIVFVNICIDNAERKDTWKKMLADKQIGGINLFYARNRPQTINLPRLYRIDDFPTYLLVNKETKIIGYNAPRPSETGTVHWVLYQASNNITLSETYRAAAASPLEMNKYLNTNRAKIDSLQPKK